MPNKKAKDTRMPRLAPLQDDQMITKSPLAKHERDHPWEIQISTQKQILAMALLK